MAMNVGNESGEGEVMVEMNTTPLIDVMLVLLTLLIITLPIQTHAVKLDMPRPNTLQPPTPPVVVTLDRSWRGKPISEMAAESARKLKAQLKNADSAEAQAALLNVRGVSATNRNDWQSARRDFLRAYSLDPNSAFSLNNLGYVSERDGDLETAQFFYMKAQQAGDANARVGLATTSTAEGARLDDIAADSDQKVGGELDRYKQARHAEPGNVELERRDGTPVDNTTPAPPAAPSPNGPTAAPPTSVPVTPPHSN